MATVLLVDDDEGVLFTLGEILEDDGYQVRRARGGAEALAQLDGVDVVVTDLAMPGMDGLEVLQRVRELDASLPVLMLTARGSERAAVATMKAGAYDYLTKPFALDEVRSAVGRAAEASTLRREARARSAEQAVGRPLIGQSAAFRRLLDDALRVAPREVPVLLQGETGTGKELIASLLHGASRRAAGPLVRFNCAALPAELAEAELFGHAKGAFTGAASARRGFFAQADRGTLVLDEVGELPAGVQAKLLRALQDGEIQPVGAGRVEHVDVRVVACTHRDLRAEVAAGRFREDLYFRLAVVVLRLPPLRERRDDIAPLALAFCQRAARRFDLPGARLSPALLDALAARPWPGNVRELENTVTRMLALSTDGELGPEALDNPPAPASPPRLAPRRPTTTRPRRRLRALPARRGPRGHLRQPVRGRPPPRHLPRHPPRQTPPPLPPLTLRVFLAAPALRGRACCSPSAPRAARASGGPKPCGARPKSALSAFAAEPKASTSSRGPTSHRLGGKKPALRVRGRCRVRGRRPGCG